MSFDFEKYKKVLENKWGKFEKLDNYYAQGFINETKKKKDGFFFNILFEPMYDQLMDLLDENKKKSTIDILKSGDLTDIWRQNSNTKIVLLPELEDFYKQYNGFKLFLSSFCIYGIWPYNKENYKYNPYDIFYTNATNWYCSMKYHPNLIAFGSLGDYAFCYDRNELKKIYVVNQFDKSPILQTFDSFEEFFDYYFYNLVEGYNEDFTKKIKNLTEIQFEKNDNFWSKNHWGNLILREKDKRKVDPIVCDNIDKLMILRKIDFPFNQFDFSKDFNFKELENYCLSHIEDNSECAMLLYDLHTYGIAKKKNSEKAEKYLGIAIKAKNPRAICEQGFMFEKEKEYKKAVKCYKYALENGSILAYQRLAHCLFEGNGIKKNPHEAFYLLKQASEYGNLDVAFEIGICKLNGTGTIPSLSGAIRVFDGLVDDFKYIPAMYKLGMLYFDEKIIRRDIEKAKYYFKMASDLGDKKSIKMLDKIEKMEGKI